MKTEINQVSGAVRCNIGCDYNTILRAEGLPDGHLHSRNGKQSQGGGSGGQDGRLLVTPAGWFAQRFPSLSAEHGEPILEQTDNNGIVSAKDISEDFLAATLGDKASPDAPTIFLPTEDKFFRYSPADGIFRHEREPVLQKLMSRLLLDCARECRNDGCDTGTLEFRFRDSASLSGVLRKARGLLEVGLDFFSAGNQLSY